MQELRPGVYYHFKDPERLYHVLGTAFHTETEESMVVYRALYDGAIAPLFVRPLVMFTETVSKPEIPYEGPRFVWVRETP